ncbi:MAG: hypothetical protein J6S84_05570 [Bacteroidales bacterium]|nr:hypothetical protein [Bacteroidales bacterium]
MERYLLRLILGIAVMSICLPVFSQVKLSDSGVTKFYDNGTRITYFEMTDFPNSAEIRDYVTKIVLENPDISRAVIYTNGETFMYESLQRIEPDMIVDAVNDALKEYKEQNGEFPPNDSPSAEKPKSNVVVRPHKASTDAKAQTASNVVNEKSVSVVEKSTSKSAESRSDAISVEGTQQAPVVDDKGSSSETIKKVYPTNNTNNKNK